MGNSTPGDMPAARGGTQGNSHARMHAGDTWVAAHRQVYLQQVGQGGYRTGRGCTQEVGEVCAGTGKVWMRATQVQQVQGAVQEACTQSGKTYMKHTREEHRELHVSRGA
jgi:hypothetical protein